MSLEVLLIADVKDLGQEGDVVKVSDGYARNYLLPRKLAAPVTQATQRKLVKMQEKREEKKKQSLLAASQKATELANLSVTIPVKISEGEKMYGSIGAAEIVEAVKSQGVELDRSSIVLDEPIRVLGVYDIKVRLHSEIETSVKVWIVEE